MGNLQKYKESMLPSQNGGGSGGANKPRSSNAALNDYYSSVMQTSPTQIAAWNAAKNLKREQDRLNRSWSDDIGDPFASSASGREKKVGLWKDESVKTNTERDDLIAELKRIQNANSIPMVKRKNEIRERLKEIDEKLGNGEMDYGSDRVASTVTGGAKGWIGPKASFYGKIGEALTNLSDKLGGDTGDYAGWATDEMSAAQIGHENDAKKREQQIAETRAMQEWGRKVSESGERDIARAQNGTGLVGRTAVELGANATQMALDRAEGPFAMVSLFTRAAGSGMQEAEKHGEQAAANEYARVIMSGGTEAQAKAAAQKAKEGSSVSLAKQILYGGTVGTVEVLTEKMTGGLAKIYGKGTADELVEGVIRRLAKSAAGRKALLVLADMSGEAFEEFVSDVVNPLAQTIYNEKSVRESYKENFSFTEALHDAFIGGLMGSLGSVTKAVSGDYSDVTGRMSIADTAEQKLSEGGAGRKEARDYAELISREMTEGVRGKDKAKLESSQSASDVLKEMQHPSERKASDQWIDQAFKDSGLSEDEINVLKEGYEAGDTTAAEYIEGILDAYGYGADGMSLDQARDSAARVGLKINNAQLEHAYKIGLERAKANGTVQTADIATEEGLEKVLTNVQVLGNQAEEAAKAYEPGQGIVKFREAMKQAIQLYAANGGNLQEIWEAAKRGELKADVSYLTAEQIKVAQKLGNEFREEQMQQAQKRSAEFEKTRQEAEAALRQAEKKNPDIAGIDKAILDANGYIVGVQQEIKSRLGNLEAMRKANPGIANTAEYKAELAEIARMKQGVMETEKWVNDMRSKRKNLAGKARKGKPGKVTIEEKAGRSGAIEYRGIDQSKLTDQQKATIRLAEKLAEFTGLNYRFVSVKTQQGNGKLRFIGGMFMAKEGTIYVNIDAEYDGMNIAAASMSHELTHWLAKFAPKEYEELKRFTLQEMQRDPQKYQEIFEERSNTASYQDLNLEEVTDEMVANACQNVFADPEAIQRLATEHRSLFDRILEFINEFINNIKAAFSSIDFKSDMPLFKEVQAVEQSAEKIRDLFMNALEAASENYQASETAANNGAQVVEDLEAAAAQGVQYSVIVEDKKTLDFLNEQEEEGKVVHTYKAYWEENGNLYPPMAVRQKNADGKWVMSNPMKPGQWVQAVEAPEKAIWKEDTQSWVFQLKKEKGGSDVYAAYNPYEHSSNWMLNDQFSAAYRRPNLVVYECVIPEIELSEGWYKAEKAKDPTGVLQWHTGTVAGQIHQNSGNERVVYLTQHIKPIRKVPDAEVAQHYKELIGDADIAVPSNVVPPSLLTALEDAGVKIKYTKEAPKKERAQLQVLEQGKVKEDIDVLTQAKGQDGEPLFQIYAFEHDEPEYRNMLTKWGGMSTQQIDDLFDIIDTAVAKIKENLEELDYASDADINDRTFHPVKDNSDSLYVVSLDFSTLCRKRILQQMVADKLSDAMGRAVTKEEQIAIRDALMAIQEEGKQIEVACALCYVESARMRSQKAINDFLAHRERELRNVFALKDKANSQAAAEKAEREKIKQELDASGQEVSYDILNDPLKNLPPKIKDRIQKATKAARLTYPLTERQQELVRIAESLPATAFTTPEGLADLAKEQPEIFNAFKQKVASASHSKGIENDVWYRFGDANKISDTIIKKMNAENGLRSQSWSDFQVKHLIDYIAATLELSVRQAKMHAYTKVIDYVELMGRTGVMINMSLIPTREYSGKLEYDNVEGFVYEEAKRLREKFPETAGTICIGMDPRQIRLLLESDEIDYVIPYHQSGMSKATRKLMHIPQWIDFQKTQGEKKLSGKAAEDNAAKYGVKLLSESDPKWHQKPNFSDWFDLEKAQETQKRIQKKSGGKGKYGVMTGGYMAMQEAAENYKKLCAERGLQPKFSYGEDDFTTSPNYWKLLIDRKMVNNKEGNIIEQKALQPNFDKGTIERILDEEVARYGRVKQDQEEAIKRVSEAMLSGNVKAGMSSDAIAEAIQKPIDNLAITAATGGDARLQAYDDLENMHPVIRQRVEDAEQLTNDVKAFFANVDENDENWLSEEDIDGMMEFARQENDHTAGDMDAPGEILDRMAQLARSSKNPERIYRLMERLLPHADMAVQTSFVGNGRENPDTAFSKWYNDRHPALYYPGYNPGDLVRWVNVSRERDYLHELLESGKLMEPELSEAKEFLNRLNNPGREVFYQTWDEEHNDFSVTFFSHMENTVYAWRNGKNQPLPEKMAANQVVGWLKGKNVKSEEIRWSGIVPYLEGKKTVTRDELLDVMQENMVNIETKVLRSGGHTGDTWSWTPPFDDEITVYRFEDLEAMANEIANDWALRPDTVSWKKEQRGNETVATFTAKDAYGKDTEIFTATLRPDVPNPGDTHWSEYIMGGGSNYREILFKIPGLDYKNRASEAHWKQDAPGTIAHARVQDMPAAGGRRVLFIEEIQSDLHNAGAKRGYKGSDKGLEPIKRMEKRRDEAAAELKEIEADVKALSKTILGRLLSNKTKFDYSADSIYAWLTGTETFPVRDINALASTRELWEASDEAVKTMTDDEYELFKDAKRIGLAASDAQILYEAEVERYERESVPDVPFAGSSDTYHEYVMKNLLREAVEGNYDTIGWTTSEQQSSRWSDAFEEGYKIEYDQMIPKFMRKYTKQWGGEVKALKLENGEEVWSVDITDEMKKRIPMTGQPLFQQYDDTYQDNANEKAGRSEAYTRIQNENAILNDVLQELQKLTKKQENTIAKLQQRLKLTKTPEVRESDAKRLASKYIRDMDSTAERKDIAEKLKALGDYVLQGRVNAEELTARARDIATDIVQAVEYKETPENVVLSEIRTAVEGQKVYLSPEFLGELNGNLKGIKDRLFGKRVYLSTEKGQDRISVDRLYEQLHAEFGEYWFPEAGSDNGPANAGEEIQIIAEVLDAAGGMTVNPFGPYMGEAVQSLANDIVADTLGGIMRPVQTDADKWKSVKDGLNERIKELKKQGELQDKEAARLWQTIYDLSVALDKAESRYKTLRTEADYRTAQARAEGAAKVAEVQARERERAAKQIKGLKDYYKDMRERAQVRREESAGVTKYRKQVQQKAGKLYEMLMTNSDKKHVPEVLKKPIAEFLESINFTSRRQLAGGEETKADQAFGVRMRELERLLSNQQSWLNGGEGLSPEEKAQQQDMSSYLDISQENLEYLRTVVQMIDMALKENRNYTVNSMSAPELKQLSNFLSNLNAAIRGLNSFMANARYESVREAAAKDIESMKELGKAGPMAGNHWRNLLVWKDGVPYYIFKRFGDGGQSIFDGFTRGWEKMAFHAQEIIDFTENLYTDKEVNAWTKDVHEITLEDGSRIKMTTAQIMELSMLLNREQARKHIEKGGIRIGDIETKKKGFKGKEHDTEHYHLSLQDIASITGLLNERQRNVAKAMQQFMARKGAEWGNEVSMKRFGYNFYTEGENYYPIRTDANDRPMADTDAQTNSMFRLLNLSSSKSLNPKASNALVVGDIFDTFSDHMADMAKLNGMGLPILDAIKWFNYKERINRPDGTYSTKTMQGTMEQAFGSQALHYFRTLMKDINGLTESGDRGADIWSKMTSSYKAVAVGANLRVALLQPTSYLRALTVLKPQYLAGAFAHKNAYKEAMEYSGTAVWKAMGYYDTDISKGMRGQIKHADNIKDKLVEKSMTLAEIGDKRTWGRLWVACKMQAAAETGLQGEELKQATAELFREVIYSSQVMDSTLTRSEMMRSKSIGDKLFTPFMAEPTLSFNILMDAASQYTLDERRYGKAQAWQKNSKHIGRALVCFVSTAAFNALAESLIDAVRDDDDEDYWDKVLQALVGEDGFLKGNLGQDLLVPNMIPGIKDVISMLSGYENRNIATEGISNLINVYKIWKETWQLANGTLDKATKATYYGKMTDWGRVYKTLQALSQLSGLPVYPLTRDAVAIWNTVMNGRKDDWKILTYDGNKLKDDQVANYEEYAAPTGISKSQYKKIMDVADVDGSVNPTQDELGAYLVKELEAGNLNEEQAKALWKSRWNKDTSETFDGWRSKKSGTKSTKTSSSDTKPTSTSSSKSTPKQVSTTVTDYDGFAHNVPLYGEAKKRSTYNAKPAGMSLDEYAKFLKSADTSGNKQTGGPNGSITQDELGYKLRDAVKSKRMSWDEASKIWAAQGWSHDLSWWAGKHP